MPVEVNADKKTPLHPSTLLFLIAHTLVLDVSIAWKKSLCGTGYSSTQSQSAYPQASGTQWPSVDSPTALHAQMQDFAGIELP